jgi:hypothetical protein
VHAIKVERWTCELLQVACMLLVHVVYYMFNICQPRAFAAV